MKKSQILSVIKTIRLPIIITLVISLILVACNPNRFISKAEAGVPQLVTSILSDPKTFNYPLSQESPNIFGLTYAGLTNQNPITGKIEPELAESWQISEDKLKIVFTLRENLKWSDGQPLTVDDVVFSYNDIYLNKEIPTDVRDTLKIGEKGLFPTVKKVDNRRVEFTVPEPFAPFLSSATANAILPAHALRESVTTKDNEGKPKFPTVKKVDNRRVEFTVPEPFAPFLSSATANAILPAHALQESVTTKDNEGKPKFLTKWGVDTPPDELIFNGPYKLERYDTSQRVIFRRNPYYWRKDAQGNPQPYIEKYVWQIVESTDTSLLQFRSGGLDAVGITPEYFSLLKRQEKQGNYKIYNGGPTPSTTFLFFNLNKGKRDGKPLVNPVKSRWFNTVEFRQAVAYAIDRQKMINNTFRGLGQLQNSPISLQSPYYLSPKDGLKVYNYEPEKSKKLLIKAGFKYNDQNQLVDAEGNRVRFTLLTNAGNRIREAMGSQIKQDLSKIGIQVDFTPLAWNTYTDKISNTLDYDCGLIGFGGGLEPNDSANLWSPDGGSHLFNQKPQAGDKPLEGREVAPWEAEIGKLYIQGARELDEAKRKAIYAKTQQITQEYLPMIYLVNPYSLIALRDRFENIQFSALGGAFWNIYEIKITK